MVEPTPDLIIYSGSFDPPHQGHLDCVSLACERFPDAEFLVIPGLKPAGAGGVHKTPKAPFEDRLELCRREFVKIPQENKITISDLEAHLPTPNFTIQTVRHLKTKNPEKNLGLLIGQDQLTQFPKWHKAKEILQDCTLIVAPRSTEDSTGSLEAERKSIAKTLELPESSMILLHGETSPAQSRLLREQLQKEQSPSATWLPEEALRYIKDRDLYKKKDERS